jgi:hypothetical protein
MNATPYPAVQNIPEVAGQNAQAAQSVQLSGNQGVNNAMNPVLQALKIIGSSINAGKQRGNPRAGAQSQAFSGLLQSMASPELSQVQQSQASEVPAPPPPNAQRPAAAPVQPQEQNIQTKQIPAAPAARPSIPRRPLNPGTPFGQQAGARPMSKQPINI